jgi:hypothetical protein
MPGSISSPRSPKPDYTASSFRGALMCDHCADDDAAEFSMVNSFHIAEIGRAAYAVKTIARLVHNSLSEPSTSGAEPLGASAHLGLLCAGEIIGTYLGDISDAMLTCARRHAEIEKADREANHD